VRRRGLADDRYAQMTQGEQTFRVMGMPALNPDGSSAWVLRAVGWCGAG
jgi:hypothetical protein